VTAGITLDAFRLHLAEIVRFTWPEEWSSQIAQVEAAVLIPLLEHADGWHVVLTRRAEHLHHHAGQVSFPGGRFEDEDASLTTTALRETHEEIGVPAEAVEVLGVLPAFSTPSGFRITPVLGCLQPSVSFVPDSFEVAGIFEVPLSFLLQRENYQRHRICWQGGVRHVYAIPYRGHFIWGATAGMLHGLANFIHAQA